MRIKVVVIVVLMLLTGCGRTTETAQETPGYEAGYVTILSELTAIMSKPDADPAASLDAVRTYVTDNKVRIADEVNTLNRAILDMPESERDGYRSKVSPKIEKALESYAQSQMHLKKRMNEAQQWELSEILSQIR